MFPTRQLKHCPKGNVCSGCNRMENTIHDGNTVQLQMIYSVLPGHLRLREVEHLLWISTQNTVCNWI